MSLLNVLRSGVKIADKVTKPLQPNVGYQRASTAFGASKGSRVTLAPAVPLRAIVDYKISQIRTRDGVLTSSRATITLLDINAVVAATGGNGIGYDDVFILPDGDKGPTIGLSGFLDAGTGRMIATTANLG